MRSDSYCEFAFFGSRSEVVAQLDRALSVAMSVAMSTVTQKKFAVLNMISHSKELVFDKTMRYDQFC